MCQCRDCATDQQQTRRARQQARSRLRGLESFIRATAQTTEANKLCVLVQLATETLGGLERFTAAWAEHWKQFREQHPASRQSLNAFSAVINLNLAAAELCPKPKFDEMTDEELREAQDRLLADHFYRNLPAFIGVLVQQGWGITPPPDSEDAPNESNAVSTTSRLLV